MKDKSIEEFEYLIDSRNRSNSDIAQDKLAMIKARKERFAETSDEDLIKMRLLQLKYQMESYLGEPENHEGEQFLNFLKTYISILYKTRKDFAKDIGITTIALSHILNNHREPKQDILYRIILHSQEVYKEVSNLEKDLWLRVYYQDKMKDFLHDNTQWKAEKGKVVKYAWGRAS